MPKKLCVRQSFLLTGCERHATIPYMTHGRTQVAAHPIRQAREQRGLSLRGLARISGVDFSTISRLENRSRGGTLETYRKIARALHTDYRLLMEN